MRAPLLFVVLLGSACGTGWADETIVDRSPLMGTEPLTWSDALDVRMRAGVHRFLDDRTRKSVKRRDRHWQRNLSDAAAYAKSVEPNRTRLAKYIGAVDTRVTPEMRPVGESPEPVVIATMPTYTIREVRWLVLEQIQDRTVDAKVKQADWPKLRGPMQVEGEGLLLVPNDKPRGYVVVLPDADQTPEQLAGLAAGVAEESQIARRLVENGFTVVVPVLLSRGNQFSRGVAGNERTHRDWIYTPGFEVGRHPLGYEVQKVRSAVDWFEKQAGEEAKIGAVGYGEGGLVAMYAAAIDPRIDAVMVSGYFGPREKLASEPLYRNVWALLDEFGDAEVATLIAPRPLVIEYSRGPEMRFATDNAGPGRLTTSEFSDLQREYDRIATLTRKDFGRRTFVRGADEKPVPFGSAAAINSLASFMDLKGEFALSGNLPTDGRSGFDALARQERAVKQLENHTQLTLRNSEYVRDEQMLPKLSFASKSSYEESAEKLRTDLRYEHIGWLDEPLVKALNPRSRKIFDELKWTGYDVVLDVWPDVFAWGILCVPKDLQPGERRPVVVCQHGLEGLPSDTIDQGNGHQYYKSFTARLAERGFITFAPHNLYRGATDFRMLQRKLNPLKASLYSIITAQHSQILNFLETLPFVDKERMAFYGLSYGGKSAMRIAALEPRYCLSICSGDYNEWVRINADVHFPSAYMYRGPEWEMVEWDLGHSFNYAEMTYLICPRPFMVERGRSDGCGIDPWIAYEFDRAKRVYDKLGLADDCVIEYFDGPHTINLVGTVDFLHEHLKWPEPKL